MKHSETDRQAIERVLRWLGLPSLRATQWDQLARFADWLKDEGTFAGGLGPNESGRIWVRHLADSLTFAGGWTEAGPPSRLLDIGAGVGLPGIPLAILWPKTHVTLLDRAGRRVDLAWRAVRWLGLENVDVRHGEALSEPPDWEGVVLRAVFPPERACEVVDAVLDPAGIAVIGLRGDTTPGAAAAISMSERTIRVVDLAPTVLDGRASLLIMGPREH